jgi:hypothetical protein
MEALQQGVMQLAGDGGALDEPLLRAHVGLRDEELDTGTVDPHAQQKE